MGPVDDVGFQKGAVRHDDVEVVEGLDRRAPRPDALDLTECPVDIDQVTDLDRPFGEQDETADGGCKNVSVYTRV